MNEKITFPNSKLKFVNFAGRDGYNRQFSVVIEDQDRAEELMAKGMNIRLTKPMEQGRYEGWARSAGRDLTYQEYLDNFQEEYYVGVTLANASKGNKIQDWIKIYTIDDSTGNASRVDITDENAVNNLENIFIRSADVVASTYDWTFQGRSGVKLYCSALYLHYLPSTATDEFYDMYVLGKNDDVELPFD